MRILHTSDLHLGRSLYGTSRQQAFESLIDWLLKTVSDEQIDTVLIAGDIFDSATPALWAQTLYYRFLTGLLKTGCRHIVITGGNHDPGLWLDAPNALLQSLNVHVIGSAQEDISREVVPLLSQDGKPEAIIMAVPYLKERDIRSGLEAETAYEKQQRIILGTHSHFQKVFDYAQSKRPANIPLIAMGHLFVANCVSGQEERDLYVGGLGMVPSSIFDPDIDYVALGHLHRPQMIDNNPTRRYCGAPLIHDFAEAQTKKSVIIIETQQRHCIPRLVEVPQFDRLMQIKGDPQSIREQLTSLVQNKAKVFCEVIQTQGTVNVQLALELREITQASDVNIIRISTRCIAESGLTQQDVPAEIRALTPDEVFELRLNKESQDNISDDLRISLRHAYAEILETIQTDTE